MTGPVLGTLVIMTKEPKLGRVKTRLARDIGEVAATTFCRHCLRETMARLSTDRRWRTQLAVSPQAARASPLLPATADRVGQGAGDLGARMINVIRRAPHGAVIVVGADIPAITAADIADAFKTLRRADVVIGPALDGGYWLIGAARRARGEIAFSGVRWSTAHALADTQAAMAGLSLAVTGRKQDVDDVSSYRALASSAGRRIVCQRRHNP